MMKSFAKYVLIFLFLANFIFVLTQTSFAEQRNVLVQIKIKTDYDDSEESIKMISNLIDLLPVREIPFHILY